MIGPADSLDLPEASSTVGFEVCTTWAKLTEVVDGRKLHFDVEVKEGDRTIGVGTHQRRVIQVPDQVPPAAG